MNNRTDSSTFVHVLNKHHYTRKIVASVFLVALLFIHSIKFLHSHKNFPVGKDYPGISLDKICALSSTTTAQDCSICNYQLPSAIGDLFATGDDQLATVNCDFNTHFLSYLSCLSFSSFETRGPPITT